MRLSGGAARSKAMRTILAAALDAKVRTLSREEIGAAGAAMMAAVKIGVYADIRECAEAWVTPSLGAITVPDPGFSGLYRSSIRSIGRSRRCRRPGLAWAGQTGACRVSAGERRERPVIAIIGDRFMLPSMFEKALRQKCGEDLEIRTLELPWPDEPMEHGYAEPGMEGLKEYQGEADEVVALVGRRRDRRDPSRAVLRCMLARLPRLRLIAVSRGGPVNIDMNAARERQIRVVNTPAATPRPWPNSPSAPCSPKPVSSPADMTPAPGRMARRSLSRGS